MTWNTAVEKQTIFLSSAGEDQYNPILEGLPFKIQVEFSENVHEVSGLVGATSPPTTSISFTQDESNPRIFTSTGITGIAPYSTVDALTYINILFTSEITGDKTIWDKKLYIASLPSNLIQVYSQSSGWVSVNFGTTLGTIPSCAQMCPVRFAPTWFNEFRKKGYGGAGYVSIYDYGTSEGDEEREEVKRNEDAVVSKVQYLYLQKHVVGTVEQHDIAVKFKTKKGASIQGVEVRIKINSLSCWGFEIKDPVTS